jgi:hypothetical protein
MLLMLVFAIMLIGFYFITSGEQRVSWSNRDNGVTYYWAVAGLEQMSNLIADYFAHTASPTPSTLANWVTTSSNFQTYPTVIATSGLPLVTATYTLYCMSPPAPGPCNANTPPVMALCSTIGSTLGSCTGTIGGNGPLAGLEGLIAPFQLTVVAAGPSNTEVKLTRTVQEVAVPIFEFGIFSDSDLSFHAGSDFNFGGRVHTNGNLFLAQNGGATLNLNDHVTAAKAIIRESLVNGYTMATYPNVCSAYTNDYCSYVNVLTTANGCPAGTEGAQTGNCLTLAQNQGSVENGPGSTVNPNWKTLSGSTYNGYIQDGTTGAKVLNLAIALPGINSQPIAMIQRPAVNESPTSALGMARFYNQASVRILLSDTQSDIMNLPGIDSTEYPYPLAEASSLGMSNTVVRNSTIPSTYCPTTGNCTLPPVTPCTPPLAEAPAENGTNDYMLAQGTTALGGYIKIEMNLESSPGTWKDITEEILAQGISRDMAAGVLDTVPQSAPALASGGSLAASTTYYYAVTALGAWGESGVSVSVNPLSEVSKQTSSSNKKVTLNWSAVTGATGYRVYRGNSSGGETGYIGGATCGTTPCTVSGSGTITYTDTGGTALTGQTPPTPCTNNSIIHLEEEATNTTSPLCTAAVGNAPGQATLAPTCPAWNAGALSAASTPTNLVPINLYDSREGEVRDNTGPTTSSLNGIMNLLEIDVGNLQLWFAGIIGTSGQYAFNGPDALNNSGFILYTSDRRMNCMDGKYELEGTCASNVITSGVATAGESGEFGNEDIVNPSVTSGAPNGTLDVTQPGNGSCPSGTATCPVEDVNGNGVLDTYGAYAHPIATPTSVSPSGVTVGGTASTAKWPAIINGLANSATENPVEVRITANQAQSNSVVVFRRALRLVNGALGNLPPVAAANPVTGSACSGGTGGGFTVVSENPIYVQGDYNASSLPTTAPNGFNDAFPLCHVPAAVMGDAVTLLSNAWQPGAQSGFTSGDANSFLYPTAPNCNNQRCATTTYFRMAVMAGKTLPFAVYNGTTALLSWGAEDTGSDGGVHNFLRYLEDWSNTNVTLNYDGSLASFYYSQQANGIYKCCNTVYQTPVRNYTFDTDFQNITKLPPGVPRFTDVNALSYYQSILPTQ